MKILEDIWSSIVGNATTRVSDPVIGTFLTSWVICNWHYLALLFWGEGNATQRVSAFYKYWSSSEFFAFNSIFVIPFIFTLSYLFIFPWFSLLVKFLQKAVNDKLHEQAVAIELIKITQQEELNKAKLKANPDKQFLEQIIQLEINRKEEVSKQRKQRTIRFTEKAIEAKAKSAEAESNKNIAKNDEEKKNNQAALERQRFNISSAEFRSTMASHRFPSAFLFISLISDSLKQDGITLSVSASCEIVAAIFGYDNFKSLLSDEKFNNENLSSVKYIYYDDNDLAKKLEEITCGENSDNEDLTSDMLFDHIRMVFDELPYVFTNIDELAQLSLELCENDAYSLLEDDGASGAMAESDTIYDEVYVEEIDSSKFDGKFTAFINASASGSHRKESDIPGRDMTIQAEIVSSVLVGKYALGELEIESVNGGLVDYWEDEA
ncbi:hypothetical protein E2R68_00715 [Psychromonas sp. RZ22]|uniref:cell envelope integrity protein TolA n=1 Tax=Psychromonas algarum TaxID=2555643 RepID=UPI00106810F5|nr:cell envelope integrity protein TolA [Psychromonas sp. RZ22]TEW56591.1 hypothetical protein E2R68_00715 [Psychromonas sp. RZ22]